MHSFVFAEPELASNLTQTQMNQASISRSSQVCLLPIHSASPPPEALHQIGQAELRDLEARFEQAGGCERGRHVEH